MTRFVNIPRHDDFYKSLKQTLNNYAIEIGVTTYIYFADILHIKGNNKQSSFSALVNHGSGKYLKVDELIHLLDNCPGHQKPTLDFLCHRYGFTCSHNADKVNCNEDFQDLFVKVANINGTLAKEYLQALEDGNIDEDEKKQLDLIMYQFRALIRSYEFGDNDDI
jgi:hypothetical protein